MPDPTPSPAPPSSPVGDPNAGSAGAPVTSAPPASADNSGPDAPNMSPGAMAVLSGQSPAPNLPQAPAAQPTQPGVWTRVLKGALLGLEGGGIPGMIVGAVDPSQPYAARDAIRQARQQQSDLNAAKVRFATEQAADMASKAAADNYALDQLPSQLQAQHDKFAQDQIDTLHSLNQNPIAVIPDDNNGAQAASAALRQIAAQSPGGVVPHSFSIHPGGLIYVYNADSFTGASGYSAYAEAAKETGAAPIPQAQFDKLSPVQQATLANQALSFWSNVPDANHIDQAVAEAKLAKSTYQAQTPDWVQNKQAMLQRYDQRIQFLQQTSQYYDRRYQQGLAIQQAAKEHAQTVSGKDANGNWDPSSLPVALVDGRMDPSQLSKRTKDYNGTLQAANAYSMERYGKPFDISGATIDYKYASAPATQNVLRYLNSLTGADNKSGNLGALVDMSNKLPRGQYPPLNRADLWAKLETGNPQVAAYHSAVTEVSDQVAKILQGGGTGSGTSDQKLKQAAALFDAGFTSDQIGAVAGTMRTLLANRKAELIGNNRYLQRQFSQPTAPAPQAAPAAKAPAAAPKAGFFSNIPGARVRP